MIHNFSLVTDTNAQLLLTKIMAIDTSCIIAAYVYPSYAGAFTPNTNFNDPESGSSTGCLTYELRVLLGPGNTIYRKCYYFQQSTWSNPSNHVNAINHITPLLNAAKTTYGAASNPITPMTQTNYMNIITNANAMALATALGAIPNIKSVRFYPPDSSQIFSTQKKDGSPAITPLIFALLMTGTGPGSTTASAYVPIIVDETVWNDPTQIASVVAYAEDAMVGIAATLLTNGSSYTMDSDFRFYSPLLPSSLPASNCIMS